MRWLGFLLCLLLPARALAQSAPEIKVQADPIVEVGGRATVKVQIENAAEPEDPTLAPSPNIAVGAPSIFRVDMFGQRTVVATFGVAGKSVGDGTVTPSVVVGGKRFTGKPVAIKVVAAGAAPRAPKPSGPTFTFPFGPSMDPFKGLFDDDDDTSPPARSAPPTDPKLGLDFAPAPIAFLHATVDKTRVVVGEQILYEIDLYVDATRSDPEFGDAHEPTLNKFVRRSLIDDAAPAQLLGLARVGGDVYRVTRVRRAALFPLEAGDLEIGSMSLAMNVGHKNAPRTTDPITIHVSEPPAEGRPSGYVLGQVGEMSLTAEVTPREIKRGDVIGVRLELSGKGNIPAALPVPVRGDLEFMEPEIHDQVGRLDADHWGGKRAFSYVVRMKREGDVDLGSIAMSFWNPEKRAYEIARAELGKVHVLPGAMSEEAAAKSKLADLGAPQAALAGLSPRKHLDDAPFFWGLLFAPVLVFISATGARTAAERARRALRERSASPARELERRLRAAEEACASSDARAADAAIVRALEQAALVRRKINVRGGTREEAARALEGAGAKKEIVLELVAIVRACEDARFAPDDGGVEAARARWKRAAKVVEDL